MSTYRGCNLSLVFLVISLVAQNSAEQVGDSSAEIWGLESPLRFNRRYDGLSIEQTGFGENNPNSQTRGSNRMKLRQNLDRDSFDLGDFKLHEKTYDLSASTSKILNKNYLSMNVDGVQVQVLSPRRPQNVSVKGRKVLVNNSVVCKNSKNLSSEPTYQKRRDSMWYTNLKIGRKMTPEEIEEFEAETEKIKAEMENENALRQEDPTLEILSRMKKEEDKPRISFMEPSKVKGWASEETERQWEPAVEKANGLIDEDGRQRDIVLEKECRKRAAALEEAGRQKEEADRKKKAALEKEKLKKEEAAEEARRQVEEAIRQREVALEKANRKQEAKLQDAHRQIEMADEQRKAALEKARRKREAAIDNASIQMKEANRQMDATLEKARRSKATTVENASGLGYCATCLMREMASKKETSEKAAAIEEAKRLREEARRKMEAALQKATRKEEAALEEANRQRELADAQKKAALEKANMKREVATEKATTQIEEAKRLKEAALEKANRKREIELDEASTHKELANKQREEAFEKARRKTETALEEAGRQWMGAEKTDEDDKSSGQRGVALENIRKMVSTLAKVHLGMHLLSK